MPITIAVHGGAGNIAESLRPEHDAGIRLALQAGRKILKKGGSALDAVIAAIMELENHPAFNAGYGSVLNAQGSIEMDAGLMDGDTLDIGAVAAIQGVRNPILAAQAVLNTQHILFAKSDALAIAKSAGIREINNNDLITPRRHEQFKQGISDFKIDSGLVDEIADTVGAVALDQQGNIVAATSTGGMSGKPAGRIGDSPLPGAGFYADRMSGGCSTTGWGETIARILLARRAVEGLEVGLPPQKAADRAIHILGDRITGAEGGLILIDKFGNVGIAHNSERMTHAWWSSLDNEEHIVA